MASGAPLVATTTSSSLAAAPGVAHGQQAGRERVLAHQRPARMQVLRVLDEPVARLVERALHRIERVALARQDRVLEEAVQLLRERPRRGRRGRWRCRPMASLRSVIWFCVSVPVLSTHRTVAAPSISTAGIRRVSTRLREIRQAPSARKIVSTTGNSSGRMAMAIAMPARNPCFQASAPPPRVSAKATTTTHAGHEPGDGEDADEAPGLRLQHRRLRLASARAPCRSCQAPCAGPWPRSRRCLARR